MFDGVILVAHRSLSLVGPMKRFFTQSIFAALAGMPGLCLGEATIEGKVALPKTHLAPVMTERYEIVSKAGVLKTEPPRAVGVRGVHRGRAVPARRSTVEEIG